MVLQEETKRNIFRTTGLCFSDLLMKDPIEDLRLKNLRGQRAKRSTDVLSRGNPQLTSGYVTNVEDVDDYFKLKWERKETEK